MDRIVQNSWGTCRISNQQNSHESSPDGAYQNSMWWNRWTPNKSEWGLCLTNRSHPLRSSSTPAAPLIPSAWPMTSEKPGRGVVVVPSPSSSSSLSVTDNATQEYFSNDEKNAADIPPPTVHATFSSLSCFPSPTSAFTPVSVSPLLSLSRSLSIFAQLSVVLWIWSGSKASNKTDFCTVHQEIILFATLSFSLLYPACGVLGLSRNSRCCCCCALWYVAGFHSKSLIQV